MTGLRTIVAGSRDIRNPACVWPVLDACPWRISRVISGHALGVDRLGEDWAEARGLPMARFEALWSLLGRAAGPQRNERMGHPTVSDALIVIRFPDSRGSRNMLEIMRSRGCEYILDIVLPRPPVLL